MAISDAWIVDAHPMQRLPDRLRRPAWFVHPWGQDCKYKLAFDTAQDTDLRKPGQSYFAVRVVRIWRATVSII